MDLIQMELFFSSWELSKCGKPLTTFQNMKYKNIKIWHLFFFFNHVFPSMLNLAYKQYLCVKKGRSVLCGELFFWVEVWGLSVGSSFGVWFPEMGLWSSWVHSKLLHQQLGEGLHRWRHDQILISTGVEWARNSREQPGPLGRTAAGVLDAARAWQLMEDL